jgi:hypothetical protein
MTQIEVDGIPGERNKSLHSNYFMHLKTETDEFDNPSDTGVPWRWIPDMVVAEKHWLKCDVVIPENSRCFICGER